MKKFFSVFAVLFAFVASGCDKQTGGMLMGGGLGGLAGSQIGSGSGKLAATGAGVLIGALLGGEVGRSLDRADHVYANQSAARAFEYAPDNERIEWRSPRHQYHGYTVPRRTYYVDQYDRRYSRHHPQHHFRQQCREYQTSVWIGNRYQHAYGTACRTPDGSWRMMNRH